MMVMGVTFAFFMAEALLHYQLGVWRDEGPTPSGVYKWTWPDRKDLLSMIVIVGVFSWLSAEVIQDLQSDNSILRDPLDLN